MVDSNKKKKWYPVYKKMPAPKRKGAKNEGKRKEGSKSTNAKTSKNDHRFSISPFLLIAVGN